MGNLLWRNRSDLAIPAPLMRVETFTLAGDTIQPLELPQQALTKLHMEESDDAFLVKFNSSGVRQWGTYYGGTGRDIGYSCATDASGNVYSSWMTNSTTGIATTGAHQTTLEGPMMPF